MDNNWNNWNNINEEPEVKAPEVDAPEVDVPEVSPAPMTSEELSEYIEQNFILSGDPYTPEDFAEEISAGFGGEIPTSFHEEIPSDFSGESQEAFTENAMVHVGPGRYDSTRNDGSQSAGDTWNGAPRNYNNYGGGANGNGSYGDGYANGSGTYGNGANGDGCRANNKKTSGYVTKKGLAIALICTMLATSGLTIGGLALGGAFDKKISAYNNNIIPTNYSQSESTNSQLSVQEIAAFNENAVVEIQTEKLVTDFWLQNYVTQGAGSGVIIDSDGYIITCNHVIEDARSITVTTKNGAHYDATVVGADELTDIAVLKIKGSNFTTATYGDSSSLAVGSLAVVMGNPLGQLGGSISTGIISALDRSVVVEGKAMTLIQTDASINPGNSGGGLFDGSGKLVGVVVAKAGDSSANVEGIGFAIPINQAAVIADQLIEYGKVRRPLIGVMIVDVTTEEAARQFGVNELGLYIDDVVGDNAKEAGFQKGDIIKAVNGNPIRNKNDLTVEINRNMVGDKVTITVSRDGELIDIETVLQDSEL